MEDFTPHISEHINEDEQAIVDEVMDSLAVAQERQRNASNPVTRLAARAAVYYYAWQLRPYDTEY